MLVFPNNTKLLATLTAKNNYKHRADNAAIRAGLKCKTPPEIMNREVEITKINWQKVLIENIHEQCR